MELTPAQKTIARDTHRFRVINCGRRFGKSTIASLEMVGKAIANDNVKVAYIANTYQQARDIVWEMLKNVARPAIKKINESRLELTIRTQYGGESIISLRGWENVETLRGLKFHFLVLDEVASMRNFWMNWQEVMRPTLTDYKGEVMFLSTPKGFNHFYDLYNMQDEDHDFKSFKFTSYDNPFLPKEEIDSARNQLTDDRFHQEYLADFRKMEGLVYKEFDRSRHVFKEEDWKQLKATRGFDSKIVGVDFGYTNPAAILFCRIDSDNNYWIIDEFYKTKQTTEELVEAISPFEPNRVYPDPAEPDRIEMIKKAGLYVKIPSKDIVAGVQHVRELFKQGRIKISSRCKNLIWELETYRYPDKKPDSNEEEKPSKDNDHAVDAMRYMFYGHKHGARQSLEARQYVPSYLK